jgi:hypothetical protein
VCIKSEKKPVVLWKGPLGRKFEIAILHDVDHFHGLKSVQRYYGFKNYCVDCTKNYDRDSTHSITCKARCYGCSKMGYGSCQNKSDVFITCLSCLRDYKNNECYNHHLIASCKLYKKCGQCKHVYSTKKKHVCEESFCQKCHSMHKPERECYIKPIENKNQEPYRICVYDLETSQVYIFYL